MGVPHQTSASANLNSEYTFDSFIVGNSNRFAFTAARAVAENLVKHIILYFYMVKVDLVKHI